MVESDKLWHRHNAYRNGYPAQNHRYRHSPYPMVHHLNFLEAPAAKRKCERVGLSQWDPCCRPITSCLYCRLKVLGALRVVRGHLREDLFEKRVKKSPSHGGWRKVVPKEAASSHNSPSKQLLAGKDCPVAHCYRCPANSL